MMNKYPLDKFPNVILRPKVVAKHEQHLDELATDIERYTKVGGYRDQSMFDWLLRVFENLGLSTVKTQYLDSLAITKTKLAMFVILIDDTVDNIDKRNFELFEELIKIPFNPDTIDSSKLESNAVKYLEFTRDLWLETINEVRTYPDYKKYQEALKFDVKQLLNSMEYSKFVNKYPNAVNLIENSAYVHHGMIVLIQFDFDLMCSDKFNDNELGILRELAYLSQKLARIGNLIGTYPRELIESDMSSEALVKFQKDYGNDFRFKVNKFLNRESRYPEFEKKLMVEWQKEYQLLKETVPQIKSIDGDKFVSLSKIARDGKLAASMR